MQDEDWLVDETGSPDSAWGSVAIKRSLDQDLVQRAQDGKLNERDLDIALSLTTEPPRRVRRAGSLEGSLSWHDPASTRPNCVSALSGL